MQEDAKSIYENAGLLGQLSIGKKIGILVVDFQLGFTDPKQSPLAGEFSLEIERTASILDKARQKGIPIFFCAIGYENDQEAGVWMKKIPTLKVLKLGSPLVEIDPRLKRRPDEVLIIKKFASAFAGTPLVANLITCGVDTLFITGTVTSGCVRASVEDAIQSGFIPFVVQDAVCDRAAEPHQSNLFDMKATCAELISTKQALAYLDEV